MTKMENKKAIKEMIVVEGIHDKQAIDRAVHADCIMTQGSTLSEQTLKMIERADRSRGVIVFTDPDYVGERLRKIISQRIPGCRHAFLSRSQATKEGDIGIENASPEAIVEALAKVRGGTVTQRPIINQEPDSHLGPNDQQAEDIPWSVMIDYGLTGRPDSKARRIAIADVLQIGYANGKQFWNRLHALRIPKEELMKAIKEANLSKIAGR